MDILFFDPTRHLFFFFALCGALTPRLEGQRWITARRGDTAAKKPEAI
jgi:hypothetical protein